MFVCGIAGGILILCTIGFFILLGILLKGNGVLSFGGDNAAPPPPPLQGAPIAPTKISIRPVDAKNDHIRGAKNAKVTIVEYSDFECPFCKRFHETMKQVLANYPNDVRWVYRHFPLDGLHQQARREAHASECAGEQGKFWEFADLILQETTSNDGLDLSKLPDYARRIGMNVDQFNGCISSEKYAAAVREDEQDAQAAGAQGTPYSVIIGPKGETTPLSGARPYADIKSAVDAILNS